MFSPTVPPIKIQTITNTIPNAIEKIYLHLNSFSPPFSIKRFIMDADAKLINIETTVKVNPENVAPQVINEFKINSRLGTVTLLGNTLFKHKRWASIFLSLVKSFSSLGLL